jgi:hypothetical protein
MASEPPSETRFDDFMIENAAIRQYHLSNRALILILAFGLYFDFLTKAKV